MLLEFIPANFVLVSEVYYSLPFRIETKDTLMSVEATLNSVGSVTIQASITGSDFYDVEGSSFTCDTSNLQSYIDCQPELLYRLKSPVQFLSAKILI